MYKIYAIESPNKDIYIGQTKQDFNKRTGKDGHKYLRTHNGKYKQAGIAEMINKYGWQNLTKKILYDNLTQEEANQKEIELIKYYRNNADMICKNIQDGGMPYKAKKVNRFDLQGNFIDQWNSIKEAAKYFNIKSASSISACCLGKRHSVKDFIWKYAN